MIPIFISTFLFRIVAQSPFAPSVLLSPRSPCALCERKLPLPLARRTVGIHVLISILSSQRVP